MTLTIAKVAGKMYLCAKIIYYGTKKKNNRYIKGVERPSEPQAARYNGYTPMW